MVDVRGAVLLYPERGGIQCGVKRKPALAFTAHA